MQLQRSGWACAVGFVFAASATLAAPLDSYRAAFFSGPYTMQNGYTGDLTLWGRPLNFKRESRPLRSTPLFSPAKPRLFVAPKAQPDLFRFDGRLPVQALPLNLKAVAKEKAAEFKLRQQTRPASHRE